MSQFGYKEFKKALQKSYVSLKINREVLDNLNVFPVPDGDTGVNMLSTIRAAVESLDEQNPSDFESTATIIGKEMANNSRGNSGFILSRFFTGFCEIVMGIENLTYDQLHEGFKRGQYQILASLMSPREGTMITVLDSMIKAMEASDKTDTIGYLEDAIKKSYETLFETPKMLPVLAKAGVIDSGALGFIAMIEGFKRGLTGEDDITLIEDDYRFEPDPTVVVEDMNLEEYRYCTEVLVKNLKSHPTDEFRDYLSQHGNSIALVNDDDMIKLHIHTDIPEEIISRLAEYGEIESTKKDDMQDQVAQMIRQVEDVRNMAVVAILPGPGFEEHYRELGATGFVHFTENLPSTAEITEIADQVEEESVLILANDSNIIPAAQLAAEQTKKSAAVLPSRNVIQGMSALYSYVETDTIEENLRNMTKSMDEASCYRLFYAARDSVFGDVSLKKGEYFVIEGDNILSVASTEKDALNSFLTKIDVDNFCSMLLYYNDELGEDKAEALAAIAEEVHSGLDGESHYGGQKKGLAVITFE